MSPRFLDLYIPPPWYLRTDRDNGIMPHKLVDSNGYGIPDQATIDEKKKQKGEAKDQLRVIDYLILCNKI